MSKCGVAVAWWVAVSVIVTVTAALAPDQNDPGSEEPPVTTKDNVPAEYCEAETFSAKCLEDEVILIKHARYGRMRSARCVIRNYGYIGCAADVLPHLDWMCSGKRECEVRIPDQALDAVNPCPGDLKTYLEVEYECIRVVSPPCHACAQSNNSAVVSGKYGHLASSVVTNGGCGTGLCPWVIKESEGRRINLTLYDFSVPEDADPRTDTQCDRLALIQEPSGGQDSHRVELCSGEGREKHVYTSHTSLIEVTIDPSFMSNDVTDQRRFIIKYEAFGCPDLTSPANAWVKREGDTLIVGCETTDTTYHLTCERNRWTGTMGSCPQTVSTDELTDVITSHSQPMGIMVATAIGIALIIGSLVLTVGLVYVRRRGLTRGPNQPPPTGPVFPVTPDPRLVIMSKMGNYCSPECQKACYQAILTSKQRPNDYEYAMEMRPLPDAPEPCYDVRNCGSSFTRQRSCQSGIAGVHCNPAFQRLPPTSEPIYRKECNGRPRFYRHYFELDPYHVDTVQVETEPKAQPTPKPPKAKAKVTTEERQNKSNRGKEFTRQGSYSGSLLSSFGKGSKSDDSASKDLLENESSSKFSWP